MFSKVAVLSTCVAAVLSASVFPNDAAQQKLMWDDFKSKHGKRYSTMEEESHRFQTFLENLKMADHRNNLEIKHGGSAVHGVTPLSDLSAVEFEANYLTADPSMKKGGATLFNVEKAPVATMGVVDWSGKFTTPVKDQGYCGSCWAFSATEQIESDAIRTLGVTYVLSPEQITQCDRTSFGCGGGWTEHAYNYVTKAGGVEQESSYPYSSASGTTGTCTSDASKFVLGVASYSTITGEDSMASYVQSTGPLSVCLDANNFNSYTGGIMSVCGTSVDHCVQAVGVDASTGGYWKVRNSWGPAWGESGYIRLAYGQNTCAITSDPTFVTVFKV